MTEHNRAVIIDDNKDITLVLSDILEMGGFNVVGIGYNGERQYRCIKNIVQILFY